MFTVASFFQEIEELESLQREGELPMEELLRLYNCPPPPMSGSPMDRIKPKKPRKKRKHLANNNHDQPATTAAEPDEGDDTQQKTPRLSDDLAAESHQPVAAPVEPPSVESSPPSLLPTCGPISLAKDDGVEEKNDADYNEQPCSQDEVGDKADTFTTNTTELSDDDDDEEEDEEEYEDNYNDGPSELVGLLNDVHHEDEEEEEADYDYYPDEAELKKAIQVGDNYQAVIPDTLLATAPHPTQATGDSDQLLWSPHSEKVTDGAVEHFLASFYKLRRHLNHPEENPGLTASQIIATSSSSSAQPTAVLKDEETALRKLLETDYNVEMALQQVCNLMQTNGAVSSQGYCGPAPVITWSEEECRNFELGIRLYGKNFTLIQATKVGSRSVQELVQFYYFWKKTERYDSFAAKQRLEKKRHSMSNQNPGIQEFMDKFLEEQQPRSISPRQSSGGGGSVTTTPPPVAMMMSSSGTVAQVDGGNEPNEAKKIVPDAEKMEVVEGGQVTSSPETSSVAVDALDGNHSLLIYADSKRHRTSGGGETKQQQQAQAHAIENKVVVDEGEGGKSIAVDIDKS